MGSAKAASSARKHIGNMAAHLFIYFSSNVRVLAEARFGADSQEPLVGRIHFLVSIIKFKPSSRGKWEYAIDKQPPSDKAAIFQFQ